MVMLIMFVIMIGTWILLDGNKWGRL